jgi:hypothetical protein
LAQHLGLPEGDFRRQRRVSYGNVAEFQAGGVVHFHIIVRLDGPEGPSTAPPAALTTEVLTETVRQACAQALVALPRQPATGGPLTAESTGREGR